MNINMDNEWIFFKEKADEAGTPLTEQQLSQFMMFFRYCPMIIRNCSKVSPAACMSKPKV